MPGETSGAAGGAVGVTKRSVSAAQVPPLAFEACARKWYVVPGDSDARLVLKVPVPRLPRAKFAVQLPGVVPPSDVPQYRVTDVVEPPVAERFPFNVAPVALTFVAARVAT